MMLTFINARLVMPEGVEPLGYLSVSHGQIVSLGPMESYQPQGEKYRTVKGYMWLQDSLIYIRMAVADTTLWMAH